MITVKGRQYNLPSVLFVCPACQRGALEWDGRWAWRCSATHATTDIDGNVTIERSCRRGFALSGLFANYGLESLFQSAHVNLHLLQLTDTARSLIHQGLIRLPYLVAGEPESATEAAQSDDDVEQVAILTYMMRETPTYGKGGL